MDFSWLPALRQQLLGALDPWVRVLSERARFSLSGSDNDAPADRALVISVSTDDGDVDVRVFEAVELLALLGGTDARLFSIQVYQAAMQHSSWLRLPESAALPIKCVVRVRHGEDFPTAITSWCERLVLGGVESTASSEYANVRALLESTYKMADMFVPPTEGLVPVVRRTRREALVVPVEVQASQGDFEARVAQLAQVAMTQHARDTMNPRVFRHHHWKPIFRVTQVDVGIPRAISAKAFLYLAQIASCGIDVRSLWVYNMDVEAETADVFAQGLQLLTGTPVRDRGDSLPTPGTIRQIDLPMFMTERTVSAVFSALMVSQSVEELSVNHQALPWLQDLPGNRSMTREQRAHLWKWVAIALFSRYASHRMRVVRLHVHDLEMDDVAAFRSAFVQPEAAIVSSGAACGELGTPMKKITASRFALSRPLPSMKSGFGMDAEFLLQDVFVEDEEGDPENREWVRVVLPGCGRGWVHRDCINGSVTDQTSPPTHMPSLTIAYMNERSKLAVLELLQLIGRNLKDLYIVNCNIEDPMDDWLLSVVQACPNLQSLALANGWKVTSMDVFANMYEDHSCQVRSLRLEDVRVHYTESVTQYLRLLGDDTRRMSKLLHKISLTANQLDAPLENIVPIIDNVLTSNIVLQDLHMFVSYQPHIPADDFGTVSAMCNKHRGKPVAVRKSPLSLLQKCAFLGAVGASRNSGAGNHPNRASQAMQRLDHRVLSLIFQFAANCESRNVSLWFHTERDPNNEPGDDDQEDVEEGAEDDAEEEEAFVGGGDNDRED